MKVRDFYRPRSCQFANDYRDKYHSSSQRNYLSKSAFNKPLDLLRLTK